MLYPPDNAVAGRPVGFSGADSLDPPGFFTARRAQPEVH